MPAKVVISGTKATLKISTTVTNLLSSVRPAKQISPQKGSQNPPHAHVNIASVAKAVAKKNGE